VKHLKNEVFKAARVRLGMTQRSLADELEVSESFIRHLENGRMQASLPVALRVARRLGEPVERLFGEAQ
jgi:putative transcriptional regulator